MIYDGGKLITILVTSCLGQFCGSLSFGDDPSNFNPKNEQNVYPFVFFLWMLR